MLLKRFEETFREAEQAYECDDMDVAISKFLDLAESGVPEACEYLGFIFKTGDSVPVDKQKSQYWYSKHVMLIQGLAQKGNLQALLDLGKLFQYGNCVKKNEKKALSIIEKSAKLGLSDAQFHLATIYLYGWCGCKQDFISYRHWLDQAVENQHPEALYLKGLDFIKDSLTCNNGIELINRSANLGFWPAEEFIQNLGKDT